MDVVYSRTGSSDDKTEICGCAMPVTTTIFCFMVHIPHYFSLCGVGEFPHWLAFNRKLRLDTIPVTTIAF